MKKIIFLLPLILALFASATVDAKKKKYPNGDFYEGEMKKGEPDGCGKMIYANGNIYEGYWVKGKYNGPGKMIYVNGDIYEGSWFMGKWDNVGLITYSNGRKLDGRWAEDGTFEGKCISCGDNILYKGIFSENSFRGEAILEKGGNTLIFTGSIQQDSKSMHGTMSYQNGIANYKGSLHNYQRNGIGNLFLSKENITISGEWEKDILLEGKGNIILNNAQIPFVINKNNTNQYEMVIKVGSSSFVEYLPISLFNNLNKAPSLIVTTNMQNAAKIQIGIQKQEQKRKIQAEEEKRQTFITQKSKKFNIQSLLWSVSDINRLKQQNIAKFNQTLKGEKVLLYGTITDFFTGEGDNTAAAYWSNGLLPSTYTQYFIELQGGIIIQAHSYEIEKLNRGETIYVIADLRKNDYHGYVFDARNEILTISLPEMKKKLCEPLGDGLQPDLKYEIMKLVKNIYR